MDIGQDHVEYTKYKPRLTRCNDAIEGSDAIKAKSTGYLPMLPGMKRYKDGSELYEIFLENALWYPGTGRTYSAYLGTMFRKPAAVEIPDEMAEVSEVFTPEGQTIDGFAVELAGGVVSGYRPGVLVDFPEIDTEGMSQATAKDAGARPYSVLYGAECIVNWGQSLINGQLKTTLVLLEEMMSLNKAKGKYEGYEFVDHDGYAKFRRLLELIKADDGYVYQQSLYVETNTATRDSGAEWKMVKSRTPIMDGATMDYIPFIPVTPSGLIWDMRNPLINDIAVLNIADYRNEALYRDALLFNGRPTPCVAGLILESSEQKSVSLGSSSILQFETDGGNWGTLGGGADAVGLKDAGVELKNRMALVGSRALAENPRGVEAAETAAIHRQGEDGVLSSVAVAVGQAMTRALEIMRDWWFSDVSGDISYTVNNDFLPGNVDAPRMTAMWTMLQAGDISYDTFYSYMDRGEVFQNGWSKEQELAAIEEDDKTRSDRLPIGEDDIDADPDITGA